MPKKRARIRALFGLMAHGARLCGMAAIWSACISIPRARAHDGNVHAPRVPGRMVGEACPRRADEHAREVKAVRTGIDLFFS